MQTAQLTQSGSGREPIDTVVYLASLASDVQMIEPMLTQVRAITARLAPTDSLSKGDEARLRDVQKQLEDYLVSHESVRAFTRESLSEHLAEQFNTIVQRRQRRLKMEMAGIIGAGLAALVAVFVLPASLSLDLRGQLAITVFFSVAGLGSAWLMVSALGAFRAQLRPALQYLALGIVFGTAVQWQLTLMALSPSLAATPYFHDNYVLMGYLAPALMFFLGLRVFTRVMQIQSRFLSFRFVGLLSLVSALAVIFFPSQWTSLMSITGRLDLAALAVVAVLTFSTSWLARLVMVRIASGYGRALHWFAAMVFFQGLGCLVMVTAGLTMGMVVSVGTASALVLTAMTAPFLIGQVAQVGAGYFAKRASQF